MLRKLSTLQVLRRLHSDRVRLLPIYGKRVLLAVNMLYVSMVVLLIFICKEVLDPADYRPLGIKPSHDHSLFLR